MFNTPVLLLVFNRPDTTAVVLNKIKEIKPKQLFVAADGPRMGNSKDTERCAMVRELILKEVDWDCELVTRFNEENLGCGLNPAGAITWFFEHVEQGIILEDDIDPSISFFYFCDELLIKYKDELKIMSISGTNFLSTNAQKNSYIFSNYAGNWGWATWKRAWQYYDYNITSWGTGESRKKLKKKFPRPQFMYLKQVFSQVYQIEQNHIWDFQWWYCRLINDGMGIVPSQNLTKNIGFNEDATHTFDVDPDIKNQKLYETNKTLKHPKALKIDSDYDLSLSAKYYSYNAPGLINRLKSIVRKIL